MTNITNYADRFESEIKQKYQRELLTADLTSNNVQFVGAKTINVPFLQLKGFKAYNRGAGFERQDISTEDQHYTLTHDRGVEFYVDSMDIDETNQVLSAANLTNTFEEQFAIPELDSFRISKMFQDYKNNGGVIDSTVITAENVLNVYDKMMEEMDEKEIPMQGRVLYVTPKINTMLKHASQVNRSFISVSEDIEDAFNRVVRSLDDVKVVVVPSNRMKTKYVFDDGCVPAVDAKQINMMLVQPQSVIAVNKHSYIKLWPEGTHQKGDGYLYQNRQYGDLFVILSRKNGIAINAAI